MMQMEISGGILTAMRSTEPPPSVGQTVIKAILAAIPYAGGSLAIIYEDTRARYIARVADLFEDILDQTGETLLSSRLAENEQVDALFLEGVDVATRSGLRAKRSLLARVIAQAVRDDAKVEPAQLVVHALRDLDAPQIRALARFRAAEDAARSAAAEEPLEVRERLLAEAMAHVKNSEPDPIISALLRTGVVSPATVWDRGLAVDSVSQFGREVLADLESETPPTVSR